MHAKSAGEGGSHVMHGRSGGGGGGGASVTMLVVEKAAGFTS